MLHPRKWENRQAKAKKWPLVLASPRERTGAPRSCQSDKNRLFAGSNDTMCCFADDQSGFWPVNKIKMFGSYSVGVTIENIRCQKVAEKNLAEASLQAFIVRLTAKWIPASSTERLTKFDRVGGTTTVHFSWSVHLVSTSLRVPCRAFRDNHHMFSTSPGTFQLSSLRKARVIFNMVAQRSSQARGSLLTPALSSDLVDPVWLIRDRFGPFLAHTIGST